MTDDADHPLRAAFALLALGLVGSAVALHQRAGALPDSVELSGVGLSRPALHQVREAAKKRGPAPRVPSPSARRAARRMGAAPVRRRAPGPDHRAPKHRT
ncbi:hypothetical protein [Streptomyces albireticuli]|uniref:Uncharacterized protein n=1 Tax=Streptomyces albireticuli TaxID=1940 RepID=A0A2A2DB12_9ACTN|nr:hypothetical protein [Streptomyces albireticuli]MCD9145454.1 hypothetical protein [Streptomyces albireticuli]MCD9164981.1 hypothetical protein [Streptomyces albireticuli]MCD9195428.1 hypothetical protein [Streptomyces albireticuli]PAU48715.1 hypothetical protein CK936_11730 [Streptomyces albireticuli]